MPPWRLFAALALAGSLTSSNGCGSERAVEEWTHSAQQRLAAAELAEVVSTARSGPLRMIDDYQAAARKHPLPPWLLPLEGVWRRGAASMQADGGSLILLGKRSLKELVWKTELPVGLHDELRVRMRVSAGTEASLAWDLRDGTHGRTNVPIRPGDELRSYGFALPPRPGGRQPGEITRLVLTPSNAPGQIEIELAELRRHAPAATRRINLGNHSLEAILGPLPTWRVVAPAHGIFQVGVGLAPPPGNAVGPEAPTVRVLAQEPNGPRVEIAARRLLRPERPTYQLVRVDLAAFAGRTVSLRVEIDEAWEDAVAWGNPRVVAPDPVDRVPVVLISIDTLRTDHLSCYGYARETTPNLDRFAERDAVLFEQATTEETYTLPAHTTLMTGLHPNEHGVDPFHPLASRYVTLAERLRGVGYTSAAFTGAGGWLRPKFGLDQGFDAYVGPQRARRTLVETGARVARWLDAHPGVRPFLFIHTFDVHGLHQVEGNELPYGPIDPAFLHFAGETGIPQSLYPPERAAGQTFEFWKPVYGKERRITALETHSLIALYDDAIRWVDHGVGALFDELHARELYDSALIIVTADHGESLGEHDLWGHGSTFEASASVPLLIKFPEGRFAGTRNDALVQLADVHATVLDVLGLEAKSGPRGTSLLGLLEGRAEPRTLAFTQRQGKQSVRSQRYKLTANDENEDWQIYDLAADPGEERSLRQPDEAIVEPLRQALDDFYRTEVPGWHLRWRRSPGTWRQRTRVRVSSAEPLVRSARLAGDRKEYIYNVALGRQAIAVDLHKIGYDELVVASRSAAEPLRLVIEAEQAIDLRLPGGAPWPVRSGEFWLDPEQPGDSPASRAGPSPGLRSSLTVWYVAPTGRSALQQESIGESIPEEQMDELRALGYVE